MADDAARNLLEAQLTALRQLYREGKLDEATLYKGIVCIAADILAVGDVIRAQSVIQTIPLDYFRNDQMAQMRADLKYAETAYVLALRLLQAGVVHLGPVVVPNMAPATA